MFDSDPTTIAHTAIIHNPDVDKITIYLSTPQIITNVILMNRGDHYKLENVMRPEQ